MAENETTTTANNKCTAPIDIESEIAAAAAAADEKGHHYR